MRRLLLKIKLFILGMIFPTYCLNCKEKIPASSNVFLCQHCIKLLNDSNLYPHALSNTRNPHTQQCFFQKAMFALEYDGEARKLMIDYKFNNRKSLSHTFGYIALDCLSCHIDTTKIDVVTCVPLSKYRFLKRGYNQNHTICHVVANGISKPCITNLLIKHIDSAPLSKMSAKERIDAVRGSILFNNNHSIKNKNILLIDDIFTTGATSNECAKVLKMNGAKNVFVLTVCQTITEEREQSASNCHVIFETNHQ